MFYEAKGLIVVVKIIFYFFNGQMIGGFECSDAGSDDRRDLIVLEVFEVFHVENEALFLG